MKRLILLLFLLFAITALSHAGGQKYIGMKNFEVTTDTLADTAGGSGLTKVSSIVYGIGFRHYQDIFARIIVEASPTTTHNYGTSDSAQIHLYYELLGENVLIDSTIFAGIPCTLNVDTTGMNIGNRWLFKCLVIDTLTDTTITANHRVRWDITARE